MILKKAIVFFLFVAVLISYFNIFQNDFAWDDKFFIIGNIHIKSLEEIPGFFAEPSTGHLYRPLRSVFYAITYQIWQLNVFGYHLNDFLLHFLPPRSPYSFGIALNWQIRRWFRFFSRDAIKRRCLRNSSRKMKDSG